MEPMVLMRVYLRNLMRADALIHCDERCEDFRRAMKENRDKNTFYHDFPYLKFTGDLVFTSPSFHSKQNYLPTF